MSLVLLGSSAINFVSMCELFHILVNLGTPKRRFSVFSDAPMRVDVTLYVLYRLSQDNYNSLTFNSDIATQCGLVKKWVIRN